MYPHDEALIAAPQTLQRPLPARRLLPVPLVGLGLGLGLLLLAGCGGAGSESGAGDKKNEAPTTAERIRVRTQKPARDRIAAYLETTSHVEAVFDADVYARATGVVKQLLAEEGDRVTRDQLLAVIDPDVATIELRQAELAKEEARRAVEESRLAFEEAQKNVTLARADADQAKRDHERNASLSAPTDSSGLRVIALKDAEASKLLWARAENAFTTAEFAVRKAELAKSAAETNLRKAEWSEKLAVEGLEKTNVRAPFDGVVSARMVKLGQSVTVQSVAFHVTDLTKLETSFYRPQRDLRVLGDGASREVVATSEAIPEAPGSERPMVFRGRVARVAPVVDPSTGTFKVTAALENPEGRLRPGLLVRVRVTLGERADAVLVPKRARVLEGEQPCVFVVRDGRTVRVPIEEGFSDTERVEVRNVGGDGQLRFDDDVVVVANVDLKEGLAVVSEGAAPSGG